MEHNYNTNGQEKKRIGKALFIAQLSQKIGLWNLIIAFCLIGVFPFYWMLVTSVRPTGELFEYPPQLLPGENADFGTYIEIFHKSDLALWLWNSVRVAFGTATLSVFIASLSGYAISRFQYRGKTTSEMTLLATQMFPGILLALPMYMVFQKLGLLDSLSGLTIAYMSFLVPVSTLLLKGFFDTIPLPLEDASLIDGASRIGTLFRITLPLALPGLAATFMFSFIIAWDEYLFARIFLRNPHNWTVSQGLASFSGEYVTPWDQVMSAAVIITLPVAAVFLLLQSYLIRGLTAGGVKG